MAVATLPNGMVVETPNPREAAFLYSEIFDCGAYLKHGLAVADGDTVFDVGANVGLFSASLARRHAGLRLVLFEPVPATFAALRRNAERLMANAHVTLVNAGVSSAPGSAAFVVDPVWSVEAGIRESVREAAAGSSAARSHAGALAWYRAAIADGRRAGVVPPRAARLLEAALEHRPLRPLVLGAIWVPFALGGLRSRRRRQVFDCPLTTVSAALHDLGLERLDLLKVDVEGAEWDVLRGVDDADWACVRQVALEVHDLDGRAERIRAFLGDRGFEVVVAQEDWALLRLQGVRMVYARR